MTAFLDNVCDKLGRDLFILQLRRGFTTGVKVRIWMLILWTNPTKIDSLEGRYWAPPATLFFRGFNMNWFLDICTYRGSSRVSLQFVGAWNQPRVKETSVFVVGLKFLVCSLNLFLLFNTAHGTTQICSWVRSSHFYTTERNTASPSAARAPPGIPTGA